MLTSYKYDPLFAGDVERHDALCILPMNIFNEKVYLFLWFWFYLLVVATTIGLLFRLLTISYVGARTLLTHSHSRFASRELIADVISHGNVGDWFLLDLLSRNLDPINFRDLLLQIRTMLAARPKVQINVELEDQISSISMEGLNFL